MEPLSWNSLHPFEGLTCDLQVEAGFLQNERGLKLAWRVQGDIPLVRWTSQVGRENLWEQTCFEAFFQTNQHPAYEELNISPEKEWKLYRFTGYRTGQHSVSDLSWQIQVEKKVDSFLVQANLLGPWPQVKRYSLTTILYLADKPTHWACAHPKNRPDFHAPFAAAIENTFP